VSYDPQRVIATLHRHGVDFVVVGGLAAVAHGAPLPTQDVDIAPERSAANLDRLAAALGELGAKLRVAGDPDGVEFPIDGPFLASQPHVLNLVTAAGDLDLTITPAGFPNGYDDLVGGSVAVDLGDGESTRIAALSDVIASKEAAGREKDLAALPYLRALADELSR
jgi:hypothetical protein